METPRPEHDDLTHPFWEALRQGHLAFQRCACGCALLPARRFCPACLSSQLSWERAGGSGILLSWVVYHTAYHPAFEAKLPYNVALVQIDEGPRLITNIVDPLDQLVGNARVQLQVEWEGDTALARFRLAAPSERPSGIGATA